MKVLLVEDDPASMAFLEILVQKEGYHIEKADNGKIALELFESFKPDIILSDINMAQMNGLELLEKIRGQKSDIIFILLTAYTSEEFVIKAIKHGANNYLKKPLSKDTIIGLLRKYKTLIEHQRNEKKLSNFVKKYNFTLQMVTEINLIPEIVNYLVQETGDIFTPDKKLDIKLGLNELIINAVEHGNLEISYTDKSSALLNNSLETLYESRMNNLSLAQRTVEIKYSLSKEYCEWIITDQGKGFSPSAIPSPLTEDGIMKLHGRGIFISKYHFDEMEYLGCGNQVRVRKNIGT
ncbi:MAG: response regulator [Bacteroidales bacterium]